LPTGALGRSLWPSVRLAAMLTLFGVAALSFMMVMYALERRDRRFTLAFACGCLLSSAYAFLAGTWPFGVVEVIWTAVAVYRYRQASFASRFAKPS
jgi:hypothetical protein